MFTNRKGEKMSEVDWQLPVNEDGHLDRLIHHKTKLHAFVDGKSLCGKYFLPKNYYETTDFKEEEIMKNKNLACKKCLSKLNVI